MEKKTILVISFSDMGNDPRVYRQLVHLKERYNVIAAGLKGPDLDGVQFYKIRPRGGAARKITRSLYLKTKMFDKYYSATFDSSELIDNIDHKQLDVILANDNDSLPLAFSFDGVPVIHDAHEYAPRQYEDLFFWRFFMQAYRTDLCSRYLKRCKAVLTVSEGIAEEYDRVFGVRPLVITNASDYVDLVPSKVDPDHIRIISHGSANVSRRIEVMIEMMDHVDDRFSLDLMLVPTEPKYYRSLEKMAAERKNVRLVPPVPMGDIIKASNPYDIGLFISQPINFNLKNVLPNKFFEYVQSRLAIAIGPSPEMARIVKEAGCGVIAKDFEPRSMATLLNGLDGESIARMKQRSHESARALSSGPNMVLLERTIEDVLGKTGQYE